jgi:hypothetical protein
MADAPRDSIKLFAGAPRPKVGGHLMSNHALLDETRLPQVEAVLTYLLDTGETPIVYPSIAGGELERSTGVADDRRVRISNARLADQRFTLDIQGFELIRHASRVVDFHDDLELARVYEPEVRTLIEGATGARDVVVFDHTRRTDDRDVMLERKLRDPARTVHNDYTERSARQRLRDLLGDAADAKRSQRFAIINVWRSMSGTVLRAPLALCDARTVGSEDLIAAVRHGRDRIGETYRLAYSARHRWYYFPWLEPLEAVLIKTFDSATDGRARFAPHAAFESAAVPPDAPPRQSIESRAFAFF